MGDPAICQFWMVHCFANYKIGNYSERTLGTPAVANIWITDGFKDT
jgi:L-rhamnose isomerase